MPYCDFVFDHCPGETCEHCKLPVDQYGNTKEDFPNCSFPHCGCDGARLCQAPSGANENSTKCNVEGMYSRTDKKARVARMTLLGIVLDEQSQETKQQKS